MGFLPLPKSVTPSRIDENVDLYDFELSEEIKSLDRGDYTSVCWDPTTSPLDDWTSWYPVIMRGLLGLGSRVRVTSFEKK